VATVLEHDGELLLAIERATAPAGRDLRAVPWEEVDRIDHQVPAVRLRVPADEVEHALELDSDKAVRDGQAEAHRVTDPPDAIPLSVPADAPRVTDRPSYLLSIALLLVGGIFLLGVLAIVGTGRRESWFWLLVFPLGLIAAAVFTGLRTYRRPYEEPSRGLSDNS
jgi:hypothetical protein